MQVEGDLGDEEVKRRVRAAGSYVPYSRETGRDWWRAIGRNNETKKGNRETKLGKDCAVIDFFVNVIGCATLMSRWPKHGVKVPTSGWEVKRCLARRRGHGEEGEGVEGGEKDDDGGGRKTFDSADAGKGGVMRQGKSATDVWMGGKMLEGADH
ncbi:hypothetical protein CPC08DRAFT_754469 [Agrocybe pediades]|nr:hypothetical protein CPC08DRAFT_754469 [Agrocybe pediades]